MTWIEALILGLVQGLTEFLPVSSSGHLELGTVLLQVQSTENLLFAVVVHCATALSTIVVFRQDIWELIVGLLKFKWNESWSFAIKILISMVPVGIIGVFFEDQISALFTGNLLLVGSMLLVTSSLLFFTYFKKTGSGQEVTMLQSVIIGLAQAVAIMPGISRSGSTIATALLLGVDKTKATRFSFLMVLIPILGASFLKLLDYLEQPAAEEGTSMVLLVGFVSAFLSGYVACKWMVNIVKKGKLTYFAIYCLVIGLIAIGAGLWMK